MTVRAANVVAPVFAAPEVVVLFLPCVAGEAGVRNLLGRLLFKGSDFSLVAVGLYVRLARPVAGLAAGDLVLPTGLFESRMCGLREALGLHLVAGRARVAADVIIRFGGRGASLRRVVTRRVRLRERTGHCEQKRSHQPARDDRAFNEPESGHGPAPLPLLCRAVLFVTCPDSAIPVLFQSEPNLS